MARKPREAPELPGFELVKTVGAGGFADVFLYKDMAMGGRDTAVKVLDPRALPDGSSLEHFQGEAELMAKVSAHPYIVQVFGSGRAPDGRPFLLMEYYPNENFEYRCRTSRLSVSESLAVGVQIASAVEAAHRADIIHHDIKPANILTSKFGHPGLTDFGIAVVQEQAQSGEGALSIPWSSPEALRNLPTGKRGDVYSLGATVYTFLAGRAPYEQPGGDNGRAALMRRGKAGRLPPIGRDDVPRSLELTLQRSMSTDPQHRQETAAEFGQDLQAIESELGYAGTHLVLEGPVQSPVRRVHVDNEATEARPVIISPEVSPSVSPRQPRIVVTRPVSQETASVLSSDTVRGARPRRPAPTPEPIGQTIRRPDADQDEEELHFAPQRRLPWILLSGAGAGLVAIIAIFIWLGGPADVTEVDDSGGIDVTEVNDGAVDTSIQRRPDPIPELIVSTTPGGQNRFSWEAQDAASQYNVIPDGEESVRQPGVTYDTDAPCIEVQVIDADGNLSDRIRECA